MGWKMFPITLKKGSTNTITIQAFDDLWAPNFDRITLHPVLSDEEATGILHTHEPHKPHETHKPHKPHKPHEKFSLSGHLLTEAPSKGIYIYDGKKILKQ